MKHLFFGIISIVFLASCQTEAQEIKKSIIKERLTILSSDDMNGRKAGTPSAQKAAAYIASEFKKIGLEPYGKETSFLQTFELQTIKPTFIEASLNGSSIAEKDLFFLSNQSQISLDQINQFKTKSLTNEEEFLESVYNYETGPKNTVYLIPKALESQFHSLQKASLRGISSIEQNEEKWFQIWLLTEAKTVNSIRLKAESAKKSVPLSNVIGVLPGKSKKDEFVLYSAHYDHIGILKPINGDSIANGADDDASGTTAVMTLAQHYKQLDTHERTLIFACFTAEELGLYGSQYFSGRINPDQVIAGINIEMIGKVSKFGKKTAFLTGYDRSDLGTILNNNLEGTAYAIHPDPYPKYRLFYRSDNATLAKQGVPAHTISTSQIDQDEHYHAVSDEVKTLKISNMTDVIKMIAKSTESIVNGKQTPSRIEKQ